MSDRGVTRATITTGWITNRDTHARKRAQWKRVSLFGCPRRRGRPRETRDGHKYIQTCIHADRQTCSPVLPASGICGGEPLRPRRRLLERWSGQAARSAGAVAVCRELWGLGRTLGAAVSVTAGSVGEAKRVRRFDRGGIQQSNGKSGRSWFRLRARLQTTSILLSAAVSQRTVYLSGGR